MASIASNPPNDAAHHETTQPARVVDPSVMLLTPQQSSCIHDNGDTGGIGHAFAGDAVDADTGERRSVVCQPIWSCGTCERCRSGLSGHCVDRQTVGTGELPGPLRISDDQPARLGSVTLPAQCVVDLPGAVDRRWAVFAWPLAIALQATRAAPLHAKPFVTVLGRGPLALLSARAMAERNASVRLISQDDATLDAADHWGLRHRSLAEVGRRGDQDVVIDAGGDPQRVAAALAMLRPRGRLLVLHEGLGRLASSWNTTPGVDLALFLERELSCDVIASGSVPEAVRVMSDPAWTDAGSLDTLVRAQIGAGEVAAWLSDSTRSQQWGTLVAA